jgi:hypothetical protein
MLTATTEVDGFAAYQCQDAAGNTAPGQNEVGFGNDSTTDISGTKSFTTVPTALTAPSTVSTQQAGCADGAATGVNPILTTTKITLFIGNGSVIGLTCTASNPNGLTGTVPLTC